MIIDFFAVPNTRYTYEIMRSLVIYASLHTINFFLLSDPVILCNTTNSVYSINDDKKRYKSYLVVLKGRQVDLLFKVCFRVFHL